MLIEKQQVSIFMNKIAIIIAMPKEEKPILSFLENPHKWENDFVKGTIGRLNKSEVLVALSGIGKVAASVTCSEIIRSFSPDIILNIGVSGGFGEDIQQGDIVLSEQVGYHDVSCGEDIPWGQVQGFPHFYEPHQAIIEKIKETNPHIKTGLVLCGDRFLSNPKEHLFIQKTFPNVKAVDMESAAIAQTAYIYQYPFLIIRIISDLPCIGNSYEQYKNFWKDRTLCTNSFKHIYHILETITNN